MHRLETVLGLLAAVAFLAALGRRLRIADPIVFALGGLALALAPPVPDIELRPDIVLLLFMPSLIFAASRNTSWTEVRHNLRPILFLAVGLVLATMAAVAGVVHLIAPELPWGVAFMLGAIVGPPDAVAATAVAGTMRLPRSIVEVLEGEGLFNDVTALVAFQVASGVVLAGTRFHLLPATGMFLYSGAVAVAVGVAIGWLGHKALHRLDVPTSEVTLGLLEPYAAYLVAERFHASGVMAVLALALYQSNLKNFALTSAGRLLSGALWEMTDFLLTGLSFVLMGLQLPQAMHGLAATTRGGFAAAAVAATVVLVRPVWVFGFNRVARPLRRDRGWTHGGMMVLSWAGMRGVISLALALSIPETLPDGQPFPGRGLIVLATFVTIFVTLVGQGLTLPLLIRRLGLRTSGRTAAQAELDATVKLLKLGLQHLEEADISEEAAAPVRRILADRLDAAERRGRRSGEPERAADAEARRLLEEILVLQHQAIQAMRRAGEIDTPTATRVQRRLDIWERSRAGLS